MTLNYKVNKTCDQIFEYLTDMSKFVTVHPVIYRIDRIWDNEFLFFETIRIGLIPWSFTYRAIIEGSHDAKKVIMRATVMKLTNIEMTFTMEPAGNFTLISEVITFKSALPVKFLMEKIFRKQHAQLFINIENIS